MIVFLVRIAPDSGISRIATVPFATQYGAC
jgi:hypothetical protein